MPRLVPRLGEDFAPGWSVSDGIRECLQNFRDAVVHDVINNNGQINDIVYAFVPNMTSKFRTCAVIDSRRHLLLGLIEQETHDDVCDLRLINFNDDWSPQLPRGLNLGSSNKQHCRYQAGSFNEGLKVGAVAILRGTSTNDDDDDDDAEGDDNTATMERRFSIFVGGQKISGIFEQDRYFVWHQRKCPSHTKVWKPCDNVASVGDLQGKIPHNGQKINGSKFEWRQCTGPDQHSVYEICNIGKNDFDWKHLFPLSLCVTNAIASNLLILRHCGKYDGKIIGMMQLSSAENQQEAFNNRLLYVQDIAVRRQHEQQDEMAATYNLLGERLNFGRDRLYVPSSFLHHKVLQLLSAGCKQYVEIREWLADMIRLHIDCFELRLLSTTKWNNAHCQNYRDEIIRHIAKFYQEQHWWPVNTEDDLQLAASLSETFSEIQRLVPVLIKSNVIFDMLTDPKLSELRSPKQWRRAQRDNATLQKPHADAVIQYVLQSRLGAEHDIRWEWKQAILIESVDGVDKMNLPDGSVVYYISDRLASAAKFHDSQRPQPCFIANNSDTCCNCCISDILLGLISTKPPRWLVKALITWDDNETSFVRKQAKRSIWAIAGEESDHAPDAVENQVLPSAKRTKIASAVNTDVNAEIVYRGIDKQHMAEDNWNFMLKAIRMSSQQDFHANVTQILVKEEWAVQNQPAGWMDVVPNPTENP